MGNYEDYIYDVFNTLEEKNLKEKFFEQLNKMYWQDKHKYKSQRDRYECALKKVIREQKN